MSRIAKYRDACRRINKRPLTWTPWTPEPPTPAALNMSVEQYRVDKRVRAAVIDGIERRRPYVIVTLTPREAELWRSDVKTGRHGVKLMFGRANTYDYLCGRPF